MLDSNYKVWTLNTSQEEIKTSNVIRKKGLVGRAKNIGLGICHKQS